MQYKLQCNATQYNTTQHNTVQYSTTQRNAMQCNTKIQYTRTKTENNAQQHHTKHQRGVTISRSIIESSLRAQFVAEMLQCLRPGDLCNWSQPRQSKKQTNNSFGCLWQPYDTRRRIYVGHNSRANWRVAAWAHYLPASRVTSKLARWHIL